MEGWRTIPVWVVAVALKIPAMPVPVAPCAATRFGQPSQQQSAAAKANRTENTQPLSLIRNPAI